MQTLSKGEPDRPCLAPALDHRCSYGATVQGAKCPFGEKTWPLAGYWNTGEVRPFCVACALRS